MTSKEKSNDNTNYNDVSMSEDSLIPIRHKDFNEFIKRKGFTGRNKYSLRELKAIFGFKPMTTGEKVFISKDNGKEFKDYESISKASIGSGIPYTTLIKAKNKYKSISKFDPDGPIPIRSGGKSYVINLIIVYKNATI